MKRRPSKKPVVKPIVAAVLKLFEDMKPKVTPFVYKVGDQVEVCTVFGDKWVGEVCYRTRDIWGGTGNVYEVTNSPEMKRGTWLPPVHEYEMKLVKSYSPRGFDLFDKVLVKQGENIWLGRVLSFTKDPDTGEGQYEVEGAPEGMVNGRFLPLAKESEMTMIQVAFADLDDNDDHVPWM